MIENEIKDAQNAGYLNNSAQTNYGNDPEKYRLTPFQIKHNAKDAREAREALGLQMIELRALKNRLQANSIA